MYYLSSICFVCLSNKNLNAVSNKETYNEICSQVKYALPELTILNPENQVNICYSCYTNIRCFYKFKKRCLKNYSRLNDYIKILQGTNNIQNHSCRELQIKIINGLELSNLKNDLNIEEENEEALMSWEEQYDHKIEPDDNIEVKNESLGSEDSADNELYQHLVKCESVLDDEQDGGSNVAKNNVPNKEATNSSTFTDSTELNCSLCTQIFSDESKFNNHMTNHINSMKDLECSICNKKFVLKGSLVRHMRFHLNLKKYECSICNKKFSQNNHLETHKKYHLGIKEFECTICNKKFTQRSTLNKHLKIHEGVKDFECTICTKRFAQSSNLVKHMKFHLGIKDFECSVCSKRFVYNCGLKQHLKIHEASASTD